MHAVLLLYSGVGMPYWLGFDYLRISNSGVHQEWLAIEGIMGACFRVDRALTFLLTGRAMGGNEVTVISSLVLHSSRGNCRMSFTSCLPPLLPARMFGPVAPRVVVAENMFYPVRVVIRLLGVVKLLGYRRVRWLRFESRGRQVAYLICAFWIAHSLACAWDRCSASADGAEEGSRAVRTVVDNADTRFWEMRAWEQWLRCLVHGLAVLRPCGFVVVHKATDEEYLFPLCLTVCGFAVQRVYLGEVVCDVLGVSKTLAMGTWRSNLTVVFAQHASIDTGTTGDLKTLLRTPRSGAPVTVALLALGSATTIARVSLHSRIADRVPSLPPGRSCQCGRQGEGTVSAVHPLCSTR